jgi:hypothetical protein
MILDVDKLVQLVGRSLVLGQLCGVDVEKHSQKVSNVNFGLKLSSVPAKGLQVWCLVGSIIPTRMWQTGCAVQPKQM